MDNSYAAGDMYDSDDMYLSDGYRRRSRSYERDMPGGGQRYVPGGRGGSWEREMPGVGRRYVGRSRSGSWEGGGDGRKRARSGSVGSSRSASRGRSRSESSRGRTPTGESSSSRGRSSRKGSVEVGGEVDLDVGGTGSGTEDVVIPDVPWPGEYRQIYRNARDREHRQRVKAAAKAAEAEVALAAVGAAANGDGEAGTNRQRSRSISMSSSTRSPSKQTATPNGRTRSTSPGSVEEVAPALGVPKAPRAKTNGKQISHMVPPTVAPPVVSAEPQVVKPTHTMMVRLGKTADLGAPAIRSIAISSDGNMIALRCMSSFFYSRSST